MSLTEACVSCCVWVWVSESDYRPQWPAPCQTLIEIFIIKLCPALSLSLSSLGSQSLTVSVSPSGREPVTEPLWTEDRAQGSGPNLITGKMRNGEIFPKQWSLVLVQTFFQTDSVSNSLSKISVCQDDFMCLCYPRVSLSLLLLTLADLTCVQYNKQEKRISFWATCWFCMRQENKLLFSFHFKRTWKVISLEFYWIMKHFKCNDFSNPIIAWLLQNTFNIKLNNFRKTFLKIRKKYKKKLNKHFESSQKLLKSNNCKYS